MNTTLSIWYPEECPKHEQPSGPVTVSDDWKRASTATVQYKCGCTLQVRGKFVRRYNRKVRA